MNDTRWGMASFLLLLGVASLIGGSVASAAAAPLVLRDLAILDIRHLVVHLEQGVVLLGVASGCMAGALVCAVVLDGSRRQPTIQAPQAWNALWRVRWTPLDDRAFKSGQRMREAVSQAVAVQRPVAHGASEAVLVPAGGAAVAISLED